MDNLFQRVSVCRGNHGAQRRKRPRTTVSPAAWRTRSLRFEPLEWRLVLSGETVTAMLGSIPSDVSNTTVFDVTVDTNIPKQDVLVQNQASVTGTNIPQTIGNVVDTTIDRAPKVTGVYVKKSTWDPAFLAHLGTSMLGDATLGYRIPSGADQLDPLPWTDINTISLTFSEPVSNIFQSSLTVHSANAMAALAMGGFSTGGGGTSATWTLASALGVDKLRAILLDTVKDAGMDQSLDGEWIDSTAVMPSGDGVSGGNFSFRFNTLAADGNGDTAVSVTDLVNMSSRVGTGPGNMNYSAYFDINGDAAINVADITFASSRLFSSTTNSLPVADPGGTAGSGWLAGPANNPARQTPTMPANSLGVVKSAALQTDVDGDGMADPGDTLRYTVVVSNTHGFVATGVVLTDMIDINTELVALSLHSQPLLNDASATPLAYTENDAATNIVPNIEAFDADGMLASATVQITTGYQNGQDVLSFTNTAEITGVFNTADGKLTLTGVTTVANYQTALRSVKYQNTSENPNTSQRTVSVQANDGAATHNLSNVESRQIDVTAVNDAPVLANIGAGAIAYTENDPATQITNTITVADVDDTNIESAVIQITGNYQNGQDVLSVNGALPGGISTAGFVAGTGAITLTGSASLASYQTALRQIRYQNTSENPSGATRTVSFTANDGDLNSNTATRDIGVTPVNDPPSDPSESYNVQANVGVIVNAANGLVMGATDPENNTPITLVAGSVGTFATTAGGSITTSADGSFTYTPQAGDRSLADTFTYTVQDSLGATDMSTVTFNVDGNVIWFVDLSAAAGGTGTLASPFDSLLDLDDSGANPDQNGDTIFLYRTTAGAANHALGAQDFDFQPNQLLIGEGVAGAVGATINTVRGFTTQPHSRLLPQINGEQHTIVTNNSDALTLSTGNTIRGLDVGNTGSGTKIVGTSFGTLSLNDVGLLGSGGALRLTTGTVQGLTAGSTAVFNDLSSSSGNHALQLTTLAGNFSGPTGSNLTGATGATILISGGTVSFTYSGNVTQTNNAPLVEVNGGHTTGTITFNTGTLSATNGTGLQFNNADSTTSYNFNGTTTLNGGDAGIDIFGGSGGTFTFGTNTSINDPSGIAYREDISTANVTYNGTINKINNANHAVDINAKTGGTTTFNGQINASTSTATAVDLTGNTGGTINFNPGGNGLDITTTSGVGFNATGGGTITVQGSGNSINSTSGTALNVASTNIGASHLTFHDISAGNNTAAADPGFGIILNATGASGRLIVTGDGNTSVGGNNSGGVIQHVTNYGISLTNTFNPSFTNMSIHDIGRNGIDGTGVSSFTFDNGQITNTGTAAAGQYEENAVAFVDKFSSPGPVLPIEPPPPPLPSGGVANTVSGNVNITDSLISGPRRNGIMIETWTGTISNLNISNNTLSGPSLASALKDATLATTSNIQDAIHVFSQGSSTLTAHITTGTVNNNTISGFRFLSGAIFIGGNGIRIAGGSGNSSNNTSATLGTAANPIEITGNDIDEMGSNGIAVSFNGQQGVSHFNIHHNGTVADPMSTMEGLGISVFFGGSGTFSALVNANAVNNNGPTVNAGSSAIGVQLDDGPAGLGNATGMAAISVNNNTVTNPDGFGIRGIARASNGTLNLYVQNNDVGTPDLPNRGAIRVDSGSAAGDVTLNLNMSGNSGPLASTTDLLVGSGLNAGIGLRKQGSMAAVNEFNIQGISASPTNAQVQAYIGSPSPPGKNFTADGTGGSANGVDIHSGSNFGTTNALPLLAAPGGVGGADLANAQLAEVVTAAINRLAVAGASAAQMALLNSVSFQIVDFAGAQLGAAGAGVVQIDINGAGHGYFVDDSPYDDNEFELLAAGGGLQADEDSAAFGRIDLLTVVLHELGHILGYDHGDEDGLMGATLETGVRYADFDELFADEGAVSALFG